MATRQIGGPSGRYREVELKFETPGPPEPPADELAGRGWHLGAGEVLELDALYYDTVDLRLARGGATLRRRGGGHDEGWHLKLPGARGDERVEIRRPLVRSVNADSGGDDLVPPELAELVFARTRGAALAPVVRITTRREARTVFDDAGASLAEIDSDAVAAYVPGLPDVARQWNEVEVELLDGDRSVLRELETLLLAGGARRAAASSKLERALELSGSEPLVARPPKLKGRRSRAASVLTAWLRRQTLELIAADTAARLETEDAIHKMRVALRRIRSALRTFRPVLAGSEGDALRAELAWFGGELSPARDLEVLRAHLAAMLDELTPQDVLGPVRARLDRRLAAEVAHAQARARAAMGSDRYAALLGRLIEFAETPPVTGRAARPIAAVGPRLVRRDLKRVRLRLAAATGLPTPERHLALHEVRKAAKAVRYAAECLEPALGRRAAVTARRFEALQDDLGQIQDSRVARQLLREEGALAGVRRGENGFTYGLVSGDEACAALDAERAFRRHLGAAMRRAKRDWRS